ncbi:hypothetical protein [Jiangella endophytica]|uniref:hypothetical protein n=1 Tax=Jiangella endophytica TaxID=1623398 RepID=UPI000E342028|nr:hypothetical protein [Jiangella endophytica]
MSVTITGARRQTGTGVAGRLNDEWDRLRADGRPDVVGRWAAIETALAGCRDLADVEAAVTAAAATAARAARGAVPARGRGVTGAAPSSARPGSAAGDAAPARSGPAPATTRGPASPTARGPASPTAQGADAVLIALLRLAHGGDPLAGRTVLQLMLGKAIRIAAGHAGRDSRDSLEHAAIAALWTVIATYPTERRPTKVAANLAMDTLGVVSRELAHRRTETPAEPDVLASVLGTDPGRAADVDLAELLAWAVGSGTISAADASLLIDIYAPAPGLDGGAAAAERAGISWAAARQRASRAVRKIACAVRADTLGEALDAA